MTERYTVKYKSSYGTIVVNTFETLDEALLEFLGLHIDGDKVQLTADVPKIEDENDEWDF